MQFKLVSDNNRKITLNMDAISAYTSRYKPGSPFDFEIVRRQSKKSDPMRKYYFSTVLPPFMDELGYEKHEDELFHHQMKSLFFKNYKEYEMEQDVLGVWRNVPSVFGKDSTMPISRKKKFVDWVIRQAARGGVYIPDPNE